MVYESSYRKVSDFLTGLVLSAVFGVLLISAFGYLYYIPTLGAYGYPIWLIEVFKYLTLGLLGTTSVVFFWNKRRYIAIGMLSTVVIGMVLFVPNTLNLLINGIPESDELIL